MFFVPGPKGPGNAERGTQCSKMAAWTPLMRTMASKLFWGLITCLSLPMWRVGMRRSKGACFVSIKVDLNPLAANAVSSDPLNGSFTVIGCPLFNAVVPLII